MGCTFCQQLKALRVNDDENDHNKSLIEEDELTQCSKLSEPIKDEILNIEETEYKGYIPTIQCLSTTNFNGIIKLKISNLARDSKWFKHCHKMEFEIHCINICKSLTFTFKSLYVVPFTYILIRIPIEINNYSIKFKMRCRFLIDINVDNYVHPSNEWFNYSNISEIQIKSSLIEEPQYKPGDVIKYRAIGVYFPRWGTIKTCSKNNNYVEIEDYNDKRLNLTLPTSRIYQATIRLSNVLDFSARLNADYSILLPCLKCHLNYNHQCKKSEIIKMYRLLSKDIFENMYCHQYGLDIKNNYKYVGKYFALNIISYIYDDINIENNIYKISCMVDGCCNKRDKLLSRSAMRYYTYQTYIEGIRTNQIIANIHNNCPQDTVYFCDICKIEINEYDYGYSCDSIPVNRHDICITCCYTQIHQNLELFQVLNSILKNDIHTDCIKEITDFITGKVISVQ